MSVAALGYMAINTGHMEQWHHILSDILGLQLRESRAASRDYKLDEWHHRLTLCASEEEGIAVVGWQLADEPALDAMAARLTAAGVKVAPGSAALCAERKVTKLYSFIDPASTMASEIFFGPLIDSTPFSPAKGISGYVTGEHGLGHVVYFVDNYAESHRFYTEVMGFKTSDFIIWDGGEKDATFYHCNPRHHSLAIMPPFDDIPAGTFNHLMLQAASINDVGVAYDQVRDEGIPLIMDFGKHTNDLTESFYMVTPSGFGLEYGCNSCTIGPDWLVRTFDAPMLWGHRMQPPP